MSVAGESIARATAAGVAAARLARFRYCEKPMRDPIRDYLAGLGTDRARELQAQLEEHWARQDAARRN